jgi:DNA polymerase-3 subunit gamma/tau
VYIIDEVHMLSTSAFNALLKTLEEPPPHVKFILATTEVQKIPITILSRCQRYDFATVGPAKILEALKNVAAQEGIDADEDALRIVARRANGSMRDSQTLLEQLLGATDGRLTAAKVHAVFGTLLEEEVIGLASAILEGDARRAVEMIGSVGERGRNLGELLDQLVDYWRGLMLAAVGGGDLDSLPGSPATREQMARDAAGRNLDAVLAGIDILTATKSKMRGSPHTQVLLEVAVVRLARLDELLGVAQLAQWVTGGGQPLQPSAGKGTPPTPPSVSTERVKKKVVPAPESKSNEAITSKMGHGEPGKEEPFEVVWDRVLEQVGPVLSAQLRQPPHSQAILGPNTLAIQYASAYNSTYDFVRGERNLDTLRRALKHVTGREWVVRVDLLTDPVANGSPSAVEPPTDAPPTPSPVRTRSQLLALPFFQAATEVLGAQLMRVDDGFDPTGEPAAPVTTDAEAAPDHPTDPDEV